MKVLMHVVQHRLSLLTILFLAVACQKGNQTPDGLSDEIYSVRFEIKDFESFTRSVGQKASIQRNQLNNRASSGGGTTAQSYEGYLYYWSFNNESLAPDVAIHSGSWIRYNGGLIPNNFAAGWVYDGYQAGRALNVAGVKELTICLPIERAISLSVFGFDISSPNTGPKAFDLYHSIDGENWVEHRLDNQFGNLNAGQRNAFTFDDVDQLDIESLDSLWFKIVPKAGERDGVGVYNPTGGLTRIDNIHLSGTATPSESVNIDQLHYHVFDANNGRLVTSDVFGFDLSNTAISIDLPHGNYQVSFVRNSSNGSLLWPKDGFNSSSYYFSNSFSNYTAAVFAEEFDIFVNENLNQAVTLNRYYSQVKFEFTDSRDLSVVKRLVITPKQDPFFFAPFSLALTDGLVDQSDIEVEPDFSLSKEFVFNQFMGKLTVAKPISYRIEAYGEDSRLLRSFDVSASIKNNVQLVFRGELLGELPFSNAFQIGINEDWDDEEVVGF